MNSKPIKVQGERGLYRDPNSGGIFADDEAYAKYKEERSKKLKEITQETRINMLERQMSELQSNLNEILSILRGK